MISFGRLLIRKQRQRTEGTDETRPRKETEESTRSLRRGIEPPWREEKAKQLAAIIAL